MSIADPATQDSSDELIVSIGRYIEALIENYPNGLSQKELAEKADVSPAAVSKIKEKLYPFCDINILAYNSQLILSPNFDLLKRVLKDLLSKNNLLKTVKILSTKYAEKTLDDANVHQILTKKIPTLIVFNKQETKMLTKFGLRLLRALQFPLEKEGQINEVLNIFGKEGSNPQQSFVLGFILGQKIEINDFDWPIESQKDIETLIAIRDKSFGLIKTIVCGFSQQLSVYKSLEIEEKQQYDEVMLWICNYYMTKYFDLLTVSLESFAKKNKLKFPKKFKKISKPLEEDLLTDILANFES